MAVNEKVNIELDSKYSGSGFSKLDADMRQTSRSLSGITSGLTSFAGIVSGVALAGIIKFGTEAVNLGKELKILKDNFNGTAKDIELFRRATAGAVTDASLIKLSNYASDLGVSLEDQALLFSLAEDAADEYGSNVESGFEKVIKATDGSKGGLRALGISVKEYNENLAEVQKTHGVNIDNLDAESQLQLRLEAIYKSKGITLDQVNKKTKDEADIIDSLSVSTENLIAAFGEGLITALGKSALAMGDQSEAVEALNKQMKDFGSSIGSFLADTLKAMQSFGSEVAMTFKVIEEFFSDITGNFFKSYGEIERKVRNDQYVKSIVDRTKQMALDSLQVGPTRADLPEGWRPGRQFDFTTIPKTGGTETSQKTKEEINKAIERVTNILLGTSLFNLSKSVSGTLPGTVSFDITSGTANIQGLQGLQARKLFAPQEVQTGISEQSIIELANLSAQVNNNITSSLQTLGVETESFVYKLIGGFSDILSLVQAFLNTAQTVSSIVGIVKSILNPLGASPAGISGGVNPNIYISSNIDGIQFFKSTYPRYINQQNYRRVV